MLKVNRMKKTLYRLISFGIVALLVIISCFSCQSNNIGKSSYSSTTGSSIKQSPTNNEQYTDDDNILVWRILIPFDHMDFLIHEFKSEVEKPLNDFLKSSNASYQVIIEESTWSELEEINNNLIKTDILSVISDPEDYQHSYQWLARNGFFISLDEYFQTNLGKIVRDFVTDIDLQLSEVEGKVYGLSTILPSFAATVYDQEALRGIGFSCEEVNTDLYENTKILKALREKYHTPPLTLTTADNSYELGLYILDSSDIIALNETGTFSIVFDTPVFRNRLKKLLKWHKAGLISIDQPNSQSLIYKPAAETFTNEIIKQNSAVDDIDPAYGRDVLIVPDISSPIMQLYRGDNKTGISTSSKHFEQSSDFLTKLFSDPQLANLLQFGTRDQDYSVNDNNQVISSNKTSLSKTILGNQLSNTLITYSTSMTTQNKMEYKKWFFKNYAIDFPYGFRFDPTAVIDEIKQCQQIIEPKTNSDQAATTTYQSICSLEINDADQAIDKLIEELKIAGAERILDEANKQLLEWRSNHEK